MIVHYCASVPGFAFWRDCNDLIHQGARDTTGTVTTSKHWPTIERLEVRISCLLLLLELFIVPTHRNVRAFPETLALKIQLSSAFQNSEFAASSSHNFDHFCSPSWVASITGETSFCPSLINDVAHST